MKHTIEHDLSDGEVKCLTERAFAQYQERYGKYAPFLSWRDDRRADLGFSVRGFKLSGSLELRPHAMDLELEVPLPLRVFRTRAIEAIDKEARRFIDEMRREQG